MLRERLQLELSAVHLLSVQMLSCCCCSCSALASVWPSRKIINSSIVHMPSVSMKPKHQGVLKVSNESQKCLMLHYFNDFKSIKLHVMSACSLFHIYITLLLEQFNVECKALRQSFIVCLHFLWSLPLGEIIFCFSHCRFYTSRKLSLSWAIFFCLRVLSFTDLCEAVRIFCFYCCFYVMH